MTTNVLPPHKRTLHLKPIRVQRGMAFGGIILAALIAFELFNFSTTDFALTDLLGDLTFIGLRWASILAIAFCGIDFAGIARLFTPEEGNAEHSEAWYLFGAWLLAATMNAILTWWGVSLAILSQENIGNAVLSQDKLLRVAPIFVAVMVWLIRVLIIGTFAVAGDRLFSLGEQKPAPSHLIPVKPGNPAINRTHPLANPIKATGTITPSVTIPYQPATSLTPSSSKVQLGSEPNFRAASANNQNRSNGNLNIPNLRR